MAAALTLLEPTVDAVLDLIVGEASCGRFRPVKGPTADPAIALPAEPLLAEITRRQQLLHQMAQTVTPDTVVIRNPASRLRAFSSRRMRSSYRPTSTTSSRPRRPSRSFSS